MKKIHCDVTVEDYIKVNPYGDGAEIVIHEGSTGSTVFLSPVKIRKLRKQLKRALIEIEGEPKKADESELRARERDFRDEKIEYKPGDQVYLIEGNCSLGLDEGPFVVDINLSYPVKLIKREGNGMWRVEYVVVNDSRCTGYAYEKSFGRRA